MASRLKIEQEHLEAANRHIVQAEERIGALQRRIEALKVTHRKSEHSETLLVSLLDSLALMQQHRRQILQTLTDERQRSALHEFGFGDRTIRIYR
jgi:hypothetical protein